MFRDLYLEEVTGGEEGFKRYHELPIRAFIVSDRLLFRVNSMSADMFLGHSRRS